MPRVASVAVVGTVAFLLSSGPARATDADEKDACIQAAETGQDLRDAQKYRLARDAFARCARDTCPAVVRQDCTDWLASTDEQAPTVVVSAHDGAGRDLTNVRVTIDGVPLTARLDGRPITLDPGSHVVRYEADGFIAAEEQVVLGAGDKNHLVRSRLVEASIGAPLPAAAPIAATSPVDASPPWSPTTAPPSRKLAPPAAAWVFGGIAVAGFASQAYFGLTAMSQRSRDLDPGGCAPHCGSDEQDAIRTKSAVADVSMGVGIVSAVFAGYLFFTARDKEPTASTAVDLSPRPGGALAAVRGSF